RNPEEPLALYFHGSINLQLIPPQLVEAIKACGFPIKLKIVGYETIGSQGSTRRLKSLLGTANSHASIEFIGATSRHLLRKQMVGMHVGWVNFINRNDELSLKHLAG